MKLKLIKLPRLKNNLTMKTLDGVRSWHKVGAVVELSKDAAHGVLSKYPELLEIQDAGSVSTEEVAKDSPKTKKTTKMVTNYENKQAQQDILDNL